MEVTILLGDRLLLKPDALKETFDNTEIVKTDTTKAQELPSTGEIKFVSDECKSVRVGDKVLFNKHAGIDAEVKGEKLLIMTEGAIWLINERA